MSFAPSPELVACRCGADMVALTNIAADRPLFVCQNCDDTQQVERNGGERVTTKLDKSFDSVWAQRIAEDWPDQPQQVTAAMLDALGEPSNRQARRSIPSALRSIVSRIRGGRK